jgi:hypothetical protein
MQDVSFLVGKVKESKADWLKECEGGRNGKAPLLEL